MVPCAEPKPISGKWVTEFHFLHAGRKNLRGKRFERPWMLFNLREDLREIEDRYHRNPSIAKQLDLAAIQLISNNRSR